MRQFDEVVFSRREFKIRTGIAQFIDGDANCSAIIDFKPGFQSQLDTFFANKTLFINTLI
jgi:hypothetical protein